ncbi:MAG: hypothetical protein FVQ83_08180 [Chloroflexi bacterium]|nr:hypothetical protein [Chloroflexota bacterium]
MPEIRETKTPQNLIHTGPTFTVSVNINNTLSKIFSDGGIPQPSPIQLNALIDTGSGLTIIQAGKIDEFGLKPIGYQPVIGVNDTKPVKHPVFRVGFTFVGVEYFDISAIVQPLNLNGIECLIGRDILANTELNYDGKTGIYSISY